MGLATDQLIITLRKPFKGTFTDTMKRWIKDIFTVNNTVNFSPYSCRTVSTSKAKRIDANIHEIIRKGYWKIWKLFFKYYDQDITEYALDDINFNRICRV